MEHINKSIQWEYNGELPTTLKDLQLMDGGQQPCIDKIDVTFTNTMGVEIQVVCEHCGKSLSIDRQITYDKRSEKLLVVVYVAKCDCQTKVDN